MLSILPPWMAEFSPGSHERKRDNAPANRLSACKPSAPFAHNGVFHAGRFPGVAEMAGRLSRPAFRGLSETTRAG